jgi:hypothetical protein
VGGFLKKKRFSFWSGIEPRFLSLVTPITVTIVTEISWLQKNYYFIGSVHALARMSGVTSKTFGEELLSDGTFTKAA